MLAMNRQERASDRLREEMRFGGWSAKRLAEAIGIPQTTLSLHLKERRVTRDVLAKAAKVMGIELEALLDSTGDTEDDEWREEKPVDLADLKLPETHYLKPEAQALFDRTIDSYRSRLWTSETIEKYADRLVGYFTTTSLLRRLGESLPELSEEMQIRVLKKAIRENEQDYADRGRDSRR